MDRLITISELAKLLNLLDPKNKKPLNHIIRYWEKEFKQIKPKIINKRRYYSAKDVELLKMIKFHLKTQGMRYKEDEVLVGPMNVKGFKPCKGDSDFSIDIYPGFSGKNPALPSGKKEGDINLNDMVKELGKLKSFVNFPRSDWEVNYGRPDKG